MLTRAAAWPKGRPKVEQHTAFFAKLAHTLTNLRQAEANIWTKLTSEATAELSPRTPNFNVEAWGCADDAREMGILRKPGLPPLEWHPTLNSGGRGAGVVQGNLSCQMALRSTSDQTFCLLPQKTEGSQ